MGCDDFTDLVEFKVLDLVGNGFILNQGLSKFSRFLAIFQVLSDKLFLCLEHLGVEVIEEYILDLHHFNGDGVKDQLYVFDGYLGEVVADHLDHPLQTLLYGFEWDVLASHVVLRQSIHEFYKF